MATSHRKIYASCLPHFRRCTDLPRNFFTPVMQNLFQETWQYICIFWYFSKLRWRRSLTHWGQVTHLCMIGSDKGLSPEQRQAIIWTNAGILLIGPLGTNFSEILIATETFSFKKMHLKMSSGKCRSFCFGLNVLKWIYITVPLFGEAASPWWRHQVETFSALLAICVGNSPVPGEFPEQRPVTRRFDVFFDLRLNNRLSNQSWGWWFEMLSCPLWRHCNAGVLVA